MTDKEKKPEPSFEQAMQRLEQIVRLLEKGDAPLEDAMGLFEEGTALAARCEKLLSTAEKRIVKLAKGPDGAPTETEFDLGDA